MLSRANSSHLMCLFRMFWFHVCIGVKTCVWIYLCVQMVCMCMCVSTEKKVKRISWFSLWNAHKTEKSKKSEKSHTVPQVLSPILSLTNENVYGFCVSARQHWIVIQLLLCFLVVVCICMYALWTGNLSADPSPLFKKLESPSVPRAFGRVVHLTGSRLTVIGGMRVRARAYVCAWVCGVSVYVLVCKRVCVSECVTQWHGHNFQLLVDVLFTSWISKNIVPTWIHMKNIYTYIGAFFWRMEVCAFGGRTDNSTRKCQEVNYEALCWVHLDVFWMHCNTRWRQRIYNGEIIRFIG